MPFMRIWVVVLGLLVVVPAAEASVVPYRTDSELVALSQRVVHARVVDSVTESTAEGGIRTRTRLAVLEDLTGGADAVLTLYEAGGQLPDGTGMWVAGAPRFVGGEDVVLCLERVGDGYRTVAMSFSAFRVTSAQSTKVTAMPVAPARPVRPIRWT